MKEKIEEIFQLYKDGLTYQEIGDRYGVTRERIRQILNQHPEFKKYLEERKEQRKQNALAEAEERLRVSRDRTMRNSLGTLFPQQVEALWDYELNGELNPREIRARSTAVEIWLRCPKDSHSWKKRPSDVSGSWSRGASGCPKCAGRSRKPVPQPPLIEKFPLLVEHYWNFEKNRELGLDPAVVTTKSNKKVWFRCSQHSHEWQAGVHSTVAQQWSKGNAGCKVCNGTIHRRIGVRSETPLFREAFPEQFERYWDDEANQANGIEIDLEAVRTGSGRRAHFKCPVDGHRWIASISAISNCWKAGKTGCAVCGRKRSSDNLKSRRAVKAVTSDKTSSDRALGAILGGLFAVAVQNSADAFSETNWLSTDFFFSSLLSEGLLRSESRKRVYGTANRTIFVANSIRRLLGEEWLDEEAVASMPEFEQFSWVQESLNLLSESSSTSEETLASLSEAVSVLLSPGNEVPGDQSPLEESGLTIVAFSPLSLVPFECSTDFKEIMKSLGASSEFLRVALVYGQILRNLVHGESLDEAITHAELSTEIKFRDLEGDIRRVFSAIKGESTDVSGVEEALMESLSLVRGPDVDFMDVVQGGNEISPLVGPIAASLYGALHGLSDLVAEESRLANPPEVLITLVQDLLAGYERGNAWKGKYPGF